jgi:hypothetical protein
VAVAQPEVDLKAAGQRQLAARIATSATAEETKALHSWVVQLLEIRATNLPAVVKAQRAVVVTRKSAIVWPVVKLLSREMKRYAWDDRGLPGRLGLGGAALGVAIFGGQGAGIAALGTAIGVPLWVVVGSGAAFAGVLIEELSRKSVDRPLATYKVIDAAKEDD